MACVTVAPLTSFARQYKETDQVSNAGGQGAQFIDPHLLNPWGIARSSTGAWWVSDEGGGVATLYNGEGVAVNAQGAPQPLVVTIPHAGQGAGGPTGVVFNGSSDFDVEAGKPAIWFLRQPISAVSAIAFWLASSGAVKSSHLTLLPVNFRDNCGTKITI
jgi:hypothetical protein